jgi:hypothetical protein
MEDVDLTQEQYKLLPSKKNNTCHAKARLKSVAPVPDGLEDSDVEMGILVDDEAELESDDNADDDDFNAAISSTSNDTGSDLAELEEEEESEQHDGSTHDTPERDEKKRMQKRTYPEGTSSTRGVVKKSKCMSQTCTESPSENGGPRNGQEEGWLTVTCGRGLARAPQPGSLRDRVTESSRCPDGMPSCANGTTCHMWACNSFSLGHANCWTKSSHRNSSCCMCLL